MGRVLIHLACPRFKARAHFATHWVIGIAAWANTLVESKAFFEDGHSHGHVRREYFVGGKYVLQVGPARKIATGNAIRSLISIWAEAFRKVDQSFPQISHTPPLVQTRRPG